MARTQGDEEDVSGTGGGAGVAGAVQQNAQAPKTAPGGVAQPLGGANAYGGPTPSTQGTAFNTPQYKGAARDPYATGPTDYTNLDRYYESNAGAANNEAQALNQRVSKEAQTAHSALGALYGQQAAGVQGSLNQALDSNSTYGGQTSLDPSQALQQQYQKAEQDRNALGSTGGVQTLLGPHGSAFSASLVNRGGTHGGGFKHTQDQYAGLDSEIGQKQQDFGSLVGAAQNRAQGNADFAQKEKYIEGEDAAYQAYQNQIRQTNAAARAKWDTTGLFNTSTHVPWDTQTNPNPHVQSRQEFDADYAAQHGGQPDGLSDSPNREVGSGVVVPQGPSSDDDYDRLYNSKESY